MGNLTLNDLMVEYLIRFHKLSNGNPYHNISLFELHEGLSSSNLQQMGIMSQLKKHGFADYTIGIGKMTPEGILEAEKHMAQTYEEKEYLVLKALVEEPKRNLVRSHDLARELSFPEEDVYVIFSDFHNKGWIHLYEEHAHLQAAGITAFLKWGKSVQTPYIVQNTNTFEIKGDGTVLQNQLLIVNRLLIKHSLKRTTPNSIMQLVLF